jgi:hypothetical protein
VRRSRGSPRGAVLARRRRGGAGTQRPTSSSCRDHEDQPPRGGLLSHLRGARKTLGILCVVLIFDVSFVVLGCMGFPLVCGA